MTWLNAMLSCLRYPWSMLVVMLKPFEGCLGVVYAVKVPSNENPD